jgi:hypothetical protein
VEGETLNTPESTSVHAKLTVTATLFQPFALGWTDLLLVTIGLVRSTLMLVSDVLAEFPALSVQVPVADWPAPSLREVGGGLLNTPDKLSEQAKLTITVTLYQLLEFGLDERELVSVGGVLSMLIPDTVADFALPALSVHVPLADWPGPSLDNVNGLGDVSTPESESVHAKLTVTLPLFQP